MTTDTLLQVIIFMVNYILYEEISYLFVCCPLGDCVESPRGFPLLFQ